MILRNGSLAEDNEGSTGFRYPPDILNADERELLAHKTGEDSEEVKKLSGLQIFANDAREVAQRNNGLLLIVAGEAFFAVTDAIVKTLQKVDPPVTTLQVRFKIQFPWAVQWS